jgi:hypothetical protein
MENFTFNLRSISRELISRDYTIQYIDTVPEKDWKQTKFVSGGMSTPSDAKRAKLRAKRKNTK